MGNAPHDAQDRHVVTALDVPAIAPFGLPATAYRCSCGVNFVGDLSALDRLVCPEEATDG